MGRTQIRPEDNGEALVNPGMGWVLHYYDNSLKNYGSRLAPADTVADFPGLSTIYLRLAWAYLEPEEGWYNWSVVDTPAQRWLREGKRIAFRFTCSESSERYATPEWVREAGAKGRFFRRGDIVSEDDPKACWEPDFDDPVFLEKLDAFLAAAGARYDGSPDVAFIDVGTMGVWGEGHTVASTRIPYGEKIVIRHVDLHLRHFPHTLLAFNDDLPSGPPTAAYQSSVEDGEKGALLYAVEHGLTLRDDSILVRGGDRAYLSAWMAPYFWDTQPVILESEHYGMSRDRGAWGDGSLYLQALEDYRASYASIHWWPDEFLAECRPLIDRMNMRLGYRLVLREASWPEEVPQGGALDFTATWCNAGAAPCLPGGTPALTLRDAEGGICAVLADEAFDVRDLYVGPPGRAPERVQTARLAQPHDLRAGTYDVFVSVGTRTGTPVIALPLNDGDGERRYRLGRVRVTEP